MNADDYGTFFLGNIQKFDAQRERSQQKHLGISSIGWCREQARRTMLGQIGESTGTSTAAIVGTWIDSGIKAARAAANPALIFDAEVALTLDLGNGTTYTLPGHPDEVDPVENSVTDYKTKNGLAMVRVHGPDEGNHYQRSGYAQALLDAGILDKSRPVIVRNIYIDRSGVDQTVHVDQDVFDPEWVRLAADWISDVVYAVDHDEEASKDKVGPLCESCEFFRPCRGEQTWQGEVVDNAELEQVAMAYEVVNARAKADKKYLAEAKLYLEGVSCKAGDMLVKSTYVNKGNGYWLLTVKKAAA